MSDAPDRPFAVLGLQQVAIGARHKSTLRTLWIDLLGLRPSGSFRSERENVDEDICSIGEGAHAVEVDLMEPIDPDGKPAVHTTPLNHIGLWIDDLPAAVDWLTAQGVRFAPGGIRRGAGGHDICFGPSEIERRLSCLGRGCPDRAGAGAARGDRCNAISRCASGALSL